MALEGKALDLTLTGRILKALKTAKF